MLLFLGAIIFVSYLLNGNYAANWIFWLYILLVIGAAVDTKFGIYAVLQGDDFYEVRHFIFRHNIKIANIDKILYQPTWIFGDKMRSVYLLDRTTREIKVRMSNGAYPLKTLRQIISDLKNRNQTIHIDDSAKALIEERG